ncbi:MAG: lasso peptide biosynthesis B2 protein, partial [Rhodothermales bacterium]|nr:lasso peptide biosynthesis B2 protein [Rhodothermales bacterium]
MSRVATFLARSRAEKRLFRQAVMLVPLVRIGLAVLGFQRVRRWLRGREDGRVLSDTNPEMVDWAVQSVARRALHDKPCLTQSLVVSHLL